MTTPTPAADPAGQPTPVPTPPKGADPTPAPTPPAGDPPKPDVMADLAKERERRRVLETEIAKSLGIELASGGTNESHLAQITGRLAPLAKMAAALGGGDPAKGPTEIEQITERLAGYEKQLAEANVARWRAEVANAAELTVDQAGELRGDTYEELKAHAERLKTLFPTLPPAPGTPRPDPSQGGKGGGSANLDAQIAEANSKGDWRAVMKLQNQKLQNTN